MSVVSIKCILQVENCITGGERRGYSSVVFLKLIMGTIILQGVKHVIICKLLWLRLKILEGEMNSCPGI